NAPTTSTSNRCASSNTHCCNLRALFFFFQAEDGIRDFHVTGVQTCALPISIESLEKALPGVVSPSSRVAARRKKPPRAVTRPARSEERRVGKECRSRRPPDHENEKREFAVKVMAISADLWVRDSHAWRILVI